MLRARCRSQLLPPTMTQAPVVVSAEEWAAGLLGEGKEKAVVKAVAERGLCVVENIIPDEVLDHLAARLDYDAAHQVASKHKFEGTSPRGPQSPPPTTCTPLPRHFPRP